MADILMPKATAVWLIENTGLTFEQIAKFCNLHHLEVRSLALDETATAMRAVDPVAAGDLTREEIAKGEADPAHVLKKSESRRFTPPPPKRKTARYTPVARRQDRPNAIAWFVRNHPEISDAQIAKLIGTTKSTIEAVRSRTHWNSSNIQPTDPVAVGLCSQIELDEIVRKAAAKKAKLEEKTRVEDDGDSLSPTAAAAPDNDEA